jgi:hypothetical protein
LIPNGTCGSKSAPNNIHYFVGGATKVFGAALYRLRKEDFGEMRRWGQSGAANGYKYRVTLQVMGPRWTPIGGSDTTPKHRLVGALFCGRRCAMFQPIDQKHDHASDMVHAVLACRD